MGTSYLIALLFALASIVRPTFLQWKPRFSNAPLIPGTALICACLCGLFALKLHIVNEAAHNFSHLPLYVRELPILAIHSSENFNNIDRKSATAIALICIVQSMLLFTLAFILQKKSRSPYIVHIIVAITAATLAALAFFSPAMEDVDLYAYVAQAMARPSAYHPDNNPFTGEYALLNRLWGLPLWPSPYGPLWIILAKITTVHMPTLFGKLLALRLLEIFVIALCAVLLAMLRLPYWAQILFAVNPMIYDVYVSEGHNDLLGVALILAAALLCRFSPYLAVLPAAAAGTVKLPFLFIGMLAFTPERSVSKRFLLGCISIGSACVVSDLTGGHWYWQALRRIAEAATHPTSLLEKSLHAISALCAVGIIYLAVCKRKFIASVGGCVKRRIVGEVIWRSGMAYSRALAATG